jgi:hypothetical protein
MLYPFTEIVRFTCDLMHLFWLIDESTDVENAQEVRKQKDIVMDAFRNPHKPRPEGEWIVGELTRE